MRPWVLPEAPTLDKCARGRDATDAVNRGLYAIVDVDTLARSNRPALPFAERLLAAGALAALQLRAKSLGAHATLDLARALAPLCHAAGVDFYVNDRPDVALLAGARGVHVGAADLAVRDVRRFASGLRVGASTHRDDDVSAALDEGPDYVAFGPVFDTRSKRDAEPVTGLEALRRVVARCSAAGRPVVAIGGITLENAARVRDSGATAGAAIASLVVDDARVTDVARALHVALGGT